MKVFENKYEIIHEWSQCYYDLWFKDGKLDRMVSTNKYTDITFNWYRNPVGMQIGICSNVLEDAVGQLCRNKEENCDITEFLQMFWNDEEYLKIVKEALVKEVDLLSKKIECINKGLEK